MKLDEYTKTALSIFCEELFDEIQYYHPYIRVIAIHFRNGLLYVGTSAQFDDYYYHDDEIRGSPEESISQVVEKHEHIMHELFAKIKLERHEKNTTRFNIVYNGKTKIINVNKNSSNKENYWTNDE